MNNKGQLKRNSHLAMVGKRTILKVKMEVIMILTTKESLLEQELNRCVNLANINGNMINVWYAQCVESVLVMETVVFLQADKTETQECYMVVAVETVAV